MAHQMNLVVGDIFRESDTYHMAKEDKGFVEKEINIEPRIVLITNKRHFYHY